MINPIQIRNYVNDSIKEQIPFQIYAWKYAIPYAFIGAIFKILSEQTLSQPSDKVIWVVSKCLETGMVLSVLKGAYNLFDRFVLNPPSVSSRKVVKVVLKKEDFEAMKSEILHLRKELNEMNKKLNRECNDDIVSNDH